MMNPVIAAVDGKYPPGLYKVQPETNINELSSLCKQKGWQFFDLDGTGISTKAEFLQRCAETMNFPAYFGHNWDALEECIRYLDEASGRRSGTKFVLLYSYPENFAQHSPAQWATAIEILQEAAEFWQSTDTPMYVLFKTNTSLLNQLEVL
jgi:hypothetical protein